MSVSGYKWDIFISHAWDHAAAWRDGDEEWVVRFDRLLQARIKELLHVEPTVFRDRPKLDRSRDLWDAVRDALRNSGVLVIVLTDPWLNSEWCPRELEFFLNQRRDRDRVLVVDVGRVAPEKLPTALQPKFRFQFWRDVDGTVIPLRSDREEYDVSSKRLVETLITQLKDLRSEPASRDFQRVYLAEVDPSDQRMQAAYDDVLQELRRDYAIEPGREFWHAPDGYETDVREALERSTLFVQLLGRTRNRPHPDAFDGFYERWLLEQAQRHGLTTLMWLDPNVNLDTLDDDYQQFLQGNARQCTLAEFKDEVHRTLAMLNRRQQIPDIGNVEQTLVLRTHTVDRERSDQLADALLALNTETLALEDFQLVREFFQQQIQKGAGRNGCVVVHAECPETESLKLLSPVRDLLSDFPPPQVRYALWQDPSGPTPLRWRHPAVDQIEQPDAQQAAQAIVELWKEA